MENDVEYLKEYIQNLERWLESAGRRKICSHCALACFPIWGKDKSECCEICDEIENLYDHSGVE